MVRPRTLPAGCAVTQWTILGRQFSSLSSEIRPYPPSARKASARSGGAVRARVSRVAFSIGVRSRGGKQGWRSGDEIYARALVRLGPGWGAATITAGSIAASIVATTALRWLFGVDFPSSVFAIAFFVPLMVAPVASFPYLRLLRGFAEERRRVKELSGLLPICAWCKKVRNDAGYWQQIEHYVEEHAEVTHAMCPTCAGGWEQSEDKER